MASHTMQLRTYIERWTQHEPNLTHSERIEEGRQYLFDFDYPFFDENYRKTFETNFIRNFYTREIGFETEELFKLRLENWLNINMPYYNQLFESELIEFDPLMNSEIITTQQLNRQAEQKVKTKGKQESDTNFESDNFNRNISADTPDGRLQLTTEDGKGVLEYASKIDENKDKGQQKSVANSTSDVDSESNVTDSEEYIRNRKGKIGVQSYSKLLKEYRETFLRIERQIFDEMNELFMLIYS